MNKKFVLDTNVLLNSIETVVEIMERGDTPVIPLMVLEELDKFKGRGSNEELKFKARTIIRFIRKNEGKIKFVHELRYGYEEYLKEYDLDPHYQDNKILMLEVLKDEDTVLVTNDQAMYYKAKAIGIVTSFGTDIEAVKDYNGKITIESNSMAEMRFASNGFVLPEDLGLVEADLFPNQFIQMKTFSGYDVGRYIKAEGKIRRIIHKGTEFSNIKVKNVGQQMALDVLIDPKINVLTISGKAGTGKTLIALAYALDAMKTSSSYDKLLLGKNTAPIDKWSYQGFTKGLTEDKLLSHFGNYTSNLEFLTRCNFKNFNESMDGKKELARLMDDGDVEVLDIASILGSSIDRKLVIIDEAQSFDIEAMKSIITRITDESKLIIIGDLKQESINKLQAGNKGFQEIINQLKGCEHVAHITLKDIERGKIQQEIANALGL